MATTKRQQIAKFLSENGFSSTFQGDLFEQAINAIELYTNKKETKAKANKVTEEELKWATDLADFTLETFPAVKIPTSQKYARDPKKEVIEAFLWFHNTYKEFGFDIVCAAITRYVSEYQLKNWEYMQTIKYFIRKQQKDKSWISNLANYCQQINDGVENSTIEHIKTPVV